MLHTDERRDRRGNIVLDSGILWLALVHTDNRPDEGKIYCNKCPLREPLRLTARYRDLPSNQSRTTSNYIIDHDPRTPLHESKSLRALLVEIFRLASCASCSAVRRSDRLGGLVDCFLGAKSELQTNTTIRTSVGESHDRIAKQSIVLS